MIDVKLVLSILTIIVTLVLALYVFVRSPKNKIGQAFLFLILSFAFWGVAETAVYLTNNLYLAVLINRWSFFAGLLIALSFVYFAYVFPYVYRVTSKWILFLSIITFLVSAIFSFLPNGIVQSGNTVSGSKVFTLGWAPLTFFVITFSIFFVYGFILLWKKYLHSSGETRTQLFHVILSSLVAVIGGAIFGLFFYYFNAFNYEIYAPVFTLVFSTTVFYLIFIRSRLT